MSHDIAVQKDLILQHLHKTPIVEVVCKQTGVGRSTYYRWRKDDEEFAEAADNAIEQSTSVINDMAESQLIKAIKNDNMTGIIFWLKYRHPAYKSRVEVNGNLHHYNNQLTPEQSELVARALNFAGLLAPQDELTEQPNETKSP